MRGLMSDNPGILNLRMKRIPEKNLPVLQRLARLKGVQTSYVAMSKEHRDASPESLLTTLRALGVPVRQPA